jgi:hypothetical protein
MNRNHRNSARERERLCVTNADEKRSDQSGRIRYGDCIDVIERRLSVIQRAVDNGDDARQMRARSNLGNDTAENAMDVLRQDDKRSTLDVIARSLENGS